MPQLSSGSVSVIAVADIYGLSGRRAELAEALRAGERAATARPGCLRYVFAARVADRDHYVLISDWRDQAAMDAHYASPEFAGFQASLHGLLARPSEMVVYELEGAARPVASGPMDPRDAD
jgi:quinol monooxygenase YgiN